MKLSQLIKDLQGLQDKTDFKDPEVLIELNDCLYTSNYQVDLQQVYDQGITSGRPGLFSEGNQGDIHLVLRKSK